MSETYLLKELSRYPIGTWADIIYRNALLFPNEEAFVYKTERIMMGYWRKPEETEGVLVDGWLHTEDMGHYDEKGYIFIGDRKKERKV